MDALQYASWIPASITRTRYWNRFLTKTILTRVILAGEQLTMKGMEPKWRAWLPMGI